MLPGSCLIIDKIFQLFISRVWIASPFILVFSPAFDNHDYDSVEYEINFTDNCALNQVHPWEMLPTRAPKKDSSLTTRLSKFKCDKEVTISRVAIAIRIGFIYNLYVVTSNNVMETVKINYL